MKYVLPALIFLCVFLGCSKGDNEVSGYEVVLTRDGIKASLTPIHSDIKPGSNPGSTWFGFRAYSADHKNEFLLSLQIDGELKPGVYGSGNTQYLIADYFVNVGEQGEKNYSNSNVPSLPENSFAINITSIDEDCVKGSFTGNYFHDFNYDELIVITDGSFTVKRR